MMGMKTTTVVSGALSRSIVLMRQIMTYSSPSSKTATSTPIYNSPTKSTYAWRYGKMFSNYKNSKHQSKVHLYQAFQTPITSTHQPSYVIGEITITCTKASPIWH